MSEIDSSLLLTSEGRVDGFSIMTDGRHNITLLKRGKQVAWFSPAVTGEVLREFLALVKDCERSACEKVVVELERPEVTTQEASYETKNKGV